MERLAAANPRVRAVRDLKTRQGREASGRFAIEGPTLLEEAIAQGLEPLDVFVTPEGGERFALVATLAAAGVPIAVVDEKTFARISDMESPAGILAVLALPALTFERAFAGGGTMLLLADLNDPGNAGTLLRAADAFGATGAVFGDLGVDPLHPKVVRSAMGSSFRIPMAVGAPHAVAAEARRAGYVAVGLTASGDPIDLAAAAFPAKTMLVVGHERHGLGRWEHLCQARVAIRMTGRAESLNAAVAGSIALYESSIRRSS